MTEEPHWLNKLRAKAKYLRRWLDRHALAEVIAPDVQKNLDFTQWQIRSIESRPDESDKIPLPDLEDTLDRDTNYLRLALPMIPKYDKDLVPGASAFTSSATGSLFAWTSRVGDLGTPSAVEYTRDVSDRLVDLRQKYNKPAEVRKLILQLKNPNTVDRLNSAVSSFEASQRGTGKRAAAANNMRNLMNGVKGDLWKLARNKRNENMTWEKMASRLAQGVPNGPQLQELLKQEASHNSIISRLSDVLKDREGLFMTDLERLWIEIQDYLITLLGLVKASR